MSPEAARIAIAKACGYRLSKHKNCIGMPMWFVPGANETHGGRISELPDYLTDLNAMHEAEKVLTKNQRSDYADAIYQIIRPNRDGVTGEWFLQIHATAAQRAEAFLKTLNLWDDTQ